MNLFFSWLSAVLVLLLAAIWPLRIIIQKRKLSKGHVVTMVYSFLRKIHKGMGIIIIPIVYFHCRIAFEASGERSFFGALLLILLILLALTFAFKKILGKNWLLLHKVLTVALLMLTAFHAFIEFG